ncbi:MAG: hypothetical protein HOK67_21955 [Deltaproteobacteria bacterium]|nr:hypothetical protein [Deltaproteobacteria bacterium]MBT4266335.1 hypothetical protein [Deltaproteobacteria bacterium]MBT4639122.1 hypothetical protein [Deltaproteobacteria bacterium]MBT6502559.1 hypothetical protein [Deltaproteobacteria bacterium]MBT7714905.1 hypothetical protein [Deltaproteobacteria bacterium]
MNFRLLLFVPLLIVLLLNTTFGQEGNQEKDSAQNQPPRILSPDLVRKQEILNSEQVFSLVFIDSDMIVKITINNVEQVFEAAKTVVITRNFEFEQGKSLIQVVAVDEAGNSSERSFLIGYGEKELKYISDATDDTDSGFNWKADVKVGFELDSNPTNDMSSAVKPLYGVVPENNQADSRWVLDGIVSANYGPYSAVGGASAIRYAKGENDFLNSLLMFGGIGYKSYLSHGRTWMLDAMLTDINVGGYDYALVQTVSPGIEFRSRGIRGEYRSLLLGVDVIFKDFAIVSRTDGLQGTLKYDFRSLDETKHHLFHHLLALGNSSEGTKQSEYTFLKLDFDWKNIWDFGLRWDFSFGVQHRTFANDTALSKDTKLISLGTKHIEIPFRLETGIGWKFSESLKAMFNTKYVFNMSNDVSYERLINSLTVSAVF